MKKLVAFVVLATLLLPLQGCFLKKIIESDEPEDLTFDDHMEDFYEQFTEMRDLKIELAMLVLETDDTEDIFEKFSAIDTATDEILTTIDLIDESLEFPEETAFIPTAKAKNPDPGSPYGVDTGYQPKGFMESIANWCTNNKYRNQDEAIRMGVYTGYKEIEKMYGDDAKNIIDPILAEVGINDIEEVLYTDMDNVDKFYNQKIKELPEGYGQNFTWHKADIEEALIEGTVEDVYNYIDNVAVLIDDEIQEGEYGEYMPEHISDFMIRTIGYNEYVDYVEKRRETQLEIENQIAEEDNWTPPDLNELIAEYEADHGIDGEGGDYYDEDYKPGDDTEVVITYNEEADQVIVGQIDTDEGNSLNLPEGDYDVLGTADNNMPVSIEDVTVTEGSTTTVYNTTTNASNMVNREFIEVLLNLGQTEVILPTQADLNDAQTQLDLQLQMQAQLEHQIEIFNSMEGSMFVTISSAARTDANNRLSEVNREIERLQSEIAEMEELLDSVAEEDEEDEWPYPETLDATGDWSSAYGDNGTISIKFPSAGGSVSGNFGSCSSHTCWSSTAKGNFLGGDGSSVSGTISGSVNATETTPYYSISGSFEGIIYLDWEYGEGTFTTHLSGDDGSYYTDTGEWWVIFETDL